MNEKSIADPLKDITRSYQSLQKQLENACRIPEAVTNFSLVGGARASKKTQLAVMSNKIDGIFKPLPGMSNKIDGIFKPSEIIKNSDFAELTNISKQIFDHLRNPIPELSIKSILPTFPSLNFPNIIIPRPTDNSILPLVPEERRAPSPETDSTTITDEVTDKKRIFIGHGHSNCWKELRDFVTTDLRLFYDEFNRSPAAGLPISKRLEQMLEEAEMAFLIMTAQNEYADGTLHASNNVIHEIGLFQGKLGFKKAIILLEEGCEEFSNIHGLVQIRFPKGNIEAAFEEIRQVLEREGIIS